MDARRLTVAPDAGYVGIISLGHGYEDRENQQAGNALTLCVKSPANIYGVVKVSCKASSDSRSRNLGRLQGAWNPTGTRVLLETPWTAPER